MTSLDPVSDVEFRQIETHLLKDSRWHHFLHFTSRAWPSSVSLGTRAWVSSGGPIMPPLRII